MVYTGAWSKPSNLPITFCWPFLLEAGFGVLTFLEMFLVSEHGDVKTLLQLKKKSEHLV